jgi:hypothetical protein
MIRFQIGDQVRVGGLAASDWNGASGVIVKIFEREADDGQSTQECAVQFPTDRRWFLAKHLIRSTPQKAVRFFRSEVLERWRDMSPEDVAVLNGDRDDLIALLQERCGFCLKRARMEVDSFLSDLHQRTGLARDVLVR